MKRILILLAVAALGGFVWFKPDEARRMAGVVPVVGHMVAGKQAGAAPPSTPQTPVLPVVVARAKRGPMPVTIDAIGTVQSMASIQIKPRIDSQIAAIEVQEGAKVKAGDLLVKLDDRALRAQLAQADAVIDKDRATLEQARRDLARAEELLGKRIGTEVGRDTAATVVRVAQAQLAADRANRDNLATLLSYTEIHSPISGRIGSIALKVGTQVRSADAQAIATVNQFDPIFVSFAVPQSLFGDLRSALAAGKVPINARVGGVTVPGVVAFVENTVDLATGTILAKAEMANADERLWPGAFVAVEATVGVEKDALTVPSAAIQIGQQGAYVFVVDSGQKARLVRVTVARTSGSNSVLSDGLSGGEQVVVDGQLRLVDGASVRIQSTNSGDGVVTGETPASASPRRS